MSCERNKLFGFSEEELFVTFNENMLRGLVPIDWDQDDPQLVEQVERAVENVSLIDQIMFERFGHSPIKDLIEIYDHE